MFADVKPGEFIVGNYGGKYGMFAVESLSSANARGSTFTQLQGEDGQDGQNGQDGDQGPRGYRGFGVYGGPSVTLSEEGGYVSTSDESAAGAGIDDFIYGMLGDVYGMFKVTALTTTKRSGETFVPLKGEDGAPGQDGQDGAQGPRGYRGYGIYGSAGIPLTYTSSGNCTIAPEYAGEAGIGDFVIGTISGGTHSGKLCLAKITSYQSSPEHLFLCSYKVIQGADGQDGQDGQDGAQGPSGYGVYGGAGITLTHTNSNYCSVLMADVPDAIKGDFVIGTISGGTHSGKLCIAKITGGSSTGLHYSCSYTPIQGSDGGGGSITVDSSLSDSSENPVQNKVIKTALDAKGTYSKPSGGIPDTDIASAATWNAKGTYSKPSGGIPASDLASAVQTSLGKADTALQSYTETDPTVPSRAKAQSKPSYTASEVGAIAAPSSPAVGAFLVWNGSAWTAQTLSAWNGGSY